MWTALYLPSDHKYPPKVDCVDESAAWEWVYDHMCQACKDERARALAGMAEEHESDWLPCASEWIVISTENYESAENSDDLFEAAGWKVIYRRETTA